MKFIFIAIVSSILLFLVNANYDVTLAHLKDREGYATVGYLPTTASGVTIGIGIDLGQQTKTGLIAKGVSSTIVTKCEKYLGLTSKAQLDAKGYKASDLVLSIAEADALSKPFIINFLAISIVFFNFSSSLTLNSASVCKEKSSLAFKLKLSI